MFGLLSRAFFLLNYVGKIVAVFIAEGRRKKEEGFSYLGDEAKSCVV
ncbi:MAG: hypothetical protein F6K39_23620 [Okeania sp. SIO3B3]|nr:hypothetical protein [Okeania sp. SIO3B3]